jgi:hypothetical protein
MPIDPTDPDLLTANQCWPRTLAPAAEPGFALLTQDKYYKAGGAGFFQRVLNPAYRFLPALAVTGRLEALIQITVADQSVAGKNYPTKRDLQVLLRANSSKSYPNITDNCRSRTI